MHERHLSAYTRRALAFTLRRVSNGRRPRRSPVWTGRLLYLMELQHESHVLHEIAHWITVPPKMRTMPNYGLGQDFDTLRGGAAIADEVRVLAIGLANRSGNGGPSSIDAALKLVLGVKEGQATALTERLCQLARVPQSSSMGPVEHQAPEQREAVRLYGEQLRESGSVDWEDPIRPFLPRPTPRIVGTELTSVHVDDPLGAPFTHSSIWMEPKGMPGQMARHNCKIPRFA